MSVPDGSDGGITVLGCRMSVPDCSDGDIKVTGTPYECY